MLKKLKMTSIKMKLLISFVLLVSTTIIALIFSVSRINYVNNSYGMLMDGIVTRTVAMSKIEALVIEAQRQVLLAYRVEGALDQPEEARRSEQIILDNKSEVMLLIDEYEESLRNDKLVNDESLNQRLATSNELRNSALMYYNGIENNLFTDSPVRNLEDNSTRQMGEDVVRLITDILDLVEETREIQTSNLEGSVSSTIKFNILMIILIVLATVIFANRIITSISSAIDNFMVSIKKVTLDGDFNVELRRTIKMKYL